MGYGGESKAEKSFGKANDRGMDVKDTRQTKENSPQRVLKDEKIKVHGVNASAVDDRKYGNEANLSHAVRKLEKDTERGHNAPTIGGHKVDHKTH
jgi:hypothetical protein